MYKEEFIVLHRNDSVYLYDDHIVVVEAFDRDDALLAYAKTMYSHNGHLLGVINDRILKGYSWNIFIGENFEFTDDDYTTELSKEDVHEQFKKEIEVALGVDGIHFTLELFNYYTDDNIVFEDLSSELVDFVSFKEVKDNIDWITIRRLDGCRL